VLKWVVFKLLGHFLALAAITASILNAQCAVSCLLRSNSAFPSPATGGSDNSCCPHKGYPAPTQRKNTDPCDHAIASAGEVRLKNSSVNFTPLTLSIVVDASDEYCPKVSALRVDGPAAFDSSDVIERASISILRV